MTQTVVIAGVGPGLGESLARKFASEGCQVGLFARSIEYLEELAGDIRKQGGEALPVKVDLTNPGDVEQGFNSVRENYGTIDTLIHHASYAAWKGLLDITGNEFERSWRVTTFGGFLCAQEVVPGMLEQGEGTIIFTGATSAVKGSAYGLAFSSAKFGVRGMAQSLARDLGPKGIHVAHVIIDGQIDTPIVRERLPDREEHTFLNPDAIAETYWHLANQDRSAWSLEVDVRPHVEEF